MHQQQHEAALRGGDGTSAMAATAGGSRRASAASVLHLAAASADSAQRVQVRHQREGANGGSPPLSPLAPPSVRRLKP